MKQVIAVLISFITLTTFGQKQIYTPKNAMNKFEEFEKKQKFLEDSTISYSGIADKTLRPILTAKINQAANDFKKVAIEKKPTDKEYQNAIKKGLERFSEIYINLDTEDRERICFYFEELMDIVGLESSGGHLNTFMYGFDPTANKK